MYINIIIVVVAVVIIIIITILLLLLKKNYINKAISEHCVTKLLGEQQTLVITAFYYQIKLE